MVGGESGRYRSDMYRCTKMASDMRRSSIFAWGFIDLAEIIRNLTNQHIVLLNLSCKSINKAIQDDTQCSETVKSRLDACRSSHCKKIKRMKLNWNGLQWVNPPPLTDMCLLSLYSFAGCTMCVAKRFDKSVEVVFEGFGCRLCKDCSRGLAAGYAKIVTCLRR